MPASIRERVLAEMARVTKPGGSVLVVDYAPPRDLPERIVSRFVRLFEGKTYAAFVRTDLAALFSRHGLRLLDDRRALHGGVRVLTAALRESAQSIEHAHH